MFDDGFKPITFVEAAFFNRDMCKFKLSQKVEIRAQSEDYSKACSKPIVFDCC